MTLSSRKTKVSLAVAAVAIAFAGVSVVKSDPAYLFSAPPIVAQTPLYIKDAQPPLNMIVMGRDHKNYLPAYNDASDLDGDGSLDIGYRGWQLKSPAPTDGSSKFKIDYYGYFNSNVCYEWEGDRSPTGNGRFVPKSVASDKKCSSQWSGDFLNYLSMSRMDALRRVLYGGWRQTDTAASTILQGAFFPQDGHSWGKEYQSTARDGYNIADYAPLSTPGIGKYHLFAVTSMVDNSSPMLRVLENGDYRIWNWVSIEGPVAGNSCFTANNARVNCLDGSRNWAVVPSTQYQNLNITTWRRALGSGSPATAVEMAALFTAQATPLNLCGNGPIAQIDTSGGNNNPFGGRNGCGQDNYLTQITGSIVIPVAGTYRFAVDGDDAVEFWLNGVRRVGWYGGHGSNRSDTNLDQYSVSLNLAAGTYPIMFRHQEGTGDDNWGLLTFSPASARRRTDYLVRVETCPATANLRDESCKVYGTAPNLSYKPTGILHDYGETQRMYFGLITGSQRNNLEGGVLRRNISNFADEIDPATGVFRTNVNGIARTIDRFRMIGGGYQGQAAGYNNLNSDVNWSWDANQGNCPTPNSSVPLANGQCRMWGNPVAEMMYESMRYFAGAGAATPRFATGGSDRGGEEERQMGLETETWRDPYAASGGYPSCARPYQTIISDINPSYDGDLPGSSFAGAITNQGNTPATISGFSAASEGQAIWNAEFGGPRDVFIGESAGVTDGAPTVKRATSFGNIRGLSPEEPTKNGTYYAASVARFGRNTDLSAAGGQQNLSTYSIALASPLPRIEFPVNGRTITIVPFAKTASGTFGQGPRKPTNNIVHFYVESIANLPGQPTDTTINGGRPYAVFRINYEDSEQGNDYDMDAIVRYTVLANADGTTITVTLDSEYAAGSADQNMGYVISGTTQDGVYLEVRDRDSGAGSFIPYDLNTPNPTLPGGCRSITTGLCGQQLPLTSTRSFSPSLTGTAAVLLNNPLWYAAKYGSPNSPQWDSNGDGVPDNYFLVTNPLNLKDQLSRAFEDIANRDLAVGVSTISGARVGDSSFTLQPTFRRARNGKDWTGNLSAVSLDSQGRLGTTLWSAQAGIPAAASRNIWTIRSLDGNGQPTSKVQFATGNVTLAQMGITNTLTQYGKTYTADEIVEYLRGDQRNELGAGNAGTLRVRSSVLGDIVNSEPVVVAPRADFGYGSYSGAMFSGYSGAGGYVSQKAGRPTVAYVGANDGMLHAFDASTQPCAAPNANVACARPGVSGRELFAFIPQAALGALGTLPTPDLRFEHKYFVDGQITVGDAKQTASDASWKTLLIGSGGGGAKSVFALDVSAPATLAATQILWERNANIDNDIGNVYGKPLLVPLQNGKWGVLFGNGYGGQRSDPSLYVLDAFTGEVITKLTGNDGAVASITLFGFSVPCGLLGGILDQACRAGGTDPVNGLGQITAIDRDGDGRVDTVYGGDLQGNLWKFDLSNASAANWSVANSNTPLFRSQATTNEAGLTQRQPITGGLRVAAGPGNGVMVYFGTGRYVFERDNDVPASPQVQSLYAIYDDSRVTTTPITRANLQIQSIGTQSTNGEFITRSISRTPVNYFGSGAVRGWYLDLKIGTGAGTGERFIATPRIQSGRVFFTTYSPTANSCDPGGSNFQYGLDLLSGAGALANVQVLPSATVACTGADCGAVAIGSADGAVQPPVVGSAVANINPVQRINPTCDPAVSSCATFEQCQVVIYPGGFVLPRPCGRQSWRQLK
ncbi:PA14 domain-containing protein [Luteimonas fraxinea]|uniref:PA14 domain-containing protein n=1 Tax=Luteimonas fraxinea TaxID=2901869 RepID=A0ABS8U9D5_9GAMM|nr:PilC/PilY family type IV pilus protein [Luteimonas fraxinea]MCD9096113.1 PA14 domain-containing protein [Luteimonas fraxinea]MCD9124702.1 PA14 domain-containing protein [Luteimonas fraxinea]UHH10718.1 PA14 domain-containing protein [Luteimonas fraxinea]